jgi:hypothetical protein
MARVIRAVVEVGAPDHISEKDLVRKLRTILCYPVQLGSPGDAATLLTTEVKEYGRVRLAEQLKERKKLRTDAFSA